MDVGKDCAIHHGETVFESQSSENDRERCQQDKIFRLRILLKQREMPNEGAPENGGKNEDPDTGTDSQREQVEQSGKGREPQESRKRVDKLLPICGYENPDGANE